MDREAFRDLLARVEALAAEKRTSEARMLLEATPVDAQPGWHYVLARLSLDLGDLPVAVHHATRAVSLSPKNASYRALLAAVLYAASRATPMLLGLAQLEAERTLELDPKTPSAQHTLGLVMLAQGRKNAARACFERAAALADARESLTHS